MSKYITCEADLNFPVPNAERVVAQVRAMYVGRPVTALAVAQVFGLSEGAIAAVLRRAENHGMVRNIEHHVSERKDRRSGLGEWRGRCGSGRHCVSGRRFERSPEPARF